MTERRQKKVAACVLGVERLERRCGRHNLELNTLKTVEMIVDFRRHPSPQLPLTLSRCQVSTVETFKFLGITVSQDLKWAININSVPKKALQRMYFLRLLRKHGMPQELLRQFYTAVIESVLCSSITVRFGAAPKKDRLRLQRTIKTAERIVGTPYPPLRTCRLPELRQERAKSSRTLRIPVTGSSGSFPQVGATDQCKLELADIPTASSLLQSTS
ncbi:uncharacterized protein LOC133475891 [Phyllopteryx taeniolatus]|uniref:uncharacterized protein LOC133475891 n=1 Tax=Phyllopteryx taeniolatus TaxID=161469 RepID=UPI002AD2681C|nr:uncharacterized protein LOC133475891 [Phyllopteryx taeniolatus]